MMILCEIVIIFVVRIAFIYFIVARVAHSDFNLSTFDAKSKSLSFLSSVIS